MTVEITEQDTFLRLAARKRPTVLLLLAKAGIKAPWQPLLAHCDVVLHPGVTLEHIGCSGCPNGGMLYPNTCKGEHRGSPDLEWHNAGQTAGLGNKRQLLSLKAHLLGAAPAGFNLDLLGSVIESASVSKPAGTKGKKREKKGTKKKRSKRGRKRSVGLPFTPAANGSPGIDGNGHAASSSNLVKSAGRVRFAPTAHAANLNATDPAAPQFTASVPVGCSPHGSGGEEEEEGDEDELAGDSDDPDGADTDTDACDCNGIAMRPKRPGRDSLQGELSAGDSDEGGSLAGEDTEVFEDEDDDDDEYNDAVGLEDEGLEDAASSGLSHTQSQAGMPIYLGTAAAQEGISKGPLLHTRSSPQLLPNELLAINSREASRANSPLHSLSSSNLLAGDGSGSGSLSMPFIPAPPVGLPSRQRRPLTTTLFPSSLSSMTNAKTLPAQAAAAAALSSGGVGGTTAAVHSVHSAALMQQAQGSLPMSCRPSSAASRPGSRPGSEGSLSRRPSSPSLSSSLFQASALLGPDTPAQLPLQPVARHLLMPVQQAVSSEHTPTHPYRSNPRPSDLPLPWTQPMTLAGAAASGSAGLMAGSASAHCWLGYGRTSRQPTSSGECTPVAHSQTPSRRESCTNVAASLALGSGLSLTAMTNALAAPSLVEGSEHSTTSTSILAHLRRSMPASVSQDCYGGPGATASSGLPSQAPAVHGGSRSLPPRATAAPQPQSQLHRRAIRPTNAALGNGLPDSSGAMLVPEARSPSPHTLLFTAGGVGVAKPWLATAATVPSASAATAAYGQAHPHVYAHSTGSSPARMHGVAMPLTQAANSSAAVDHLLSEIRRASRHIPRGTWDGSATALPPPPEPIPFSRVALTRSPKDFSGASSGCPSVPIAAVSSAPGIAVTVNGGSTLTSAMPVSLGTTTGLNRPMGAPQPARFLTPPDDGHGPAGSSNGSPSAAVGALASGPGMGQGGGRGNTPMPQERHSCNGVMSGMRQSSETGAGSLLLPRLALVRAGPGKGEPLLGSAAHASLLYVEGQLHGVQSRGLNGLSTQHQDMMTRSAAGRFTPGPYSITSAVDCPPLGSELRANALAPSAKCASSQAARQALARGLLYQQ